MSALLFSEYSCQRFHSMKCMVSESSVCSVRILSFEVGDEA
jgi:hypothetical protein